MIHVDIDISAIEALEDLPEAAVAEARRMIPTLTAQVHGKVIELAQQRLHTRRGMYLKGLSQFEIDKDTWCVNLDASVRWIDDGLDPHSMLEDLLASPKAKRSKDGGKYVVVPFQHNKPKQNLTPAQQSLLATVKKELAKVGATPNKIETDRDGNPKLGLVRSLDITRAPKSTRRLPIGAGPWGSVAQGPTGIPLLQGVRIYQKKLKGEDGEERTGRFVMTFRTASDKHKDQEGRWYHPGLEATNLMDEAAKWAVGVWEREIGPELIRRILVSVG